MQRNLTRLSEELYDLLIIGGGINGLATAFDASQRGLQVALVEMGDFGGATSASSLKIIHGGLRYLQHLDFRRMRESIRERNAMMRLAPKLIQPMPFLVPTYGHGMKGREALAAALLVNDIVGASRNQGLEPERQLPRGRTLSRSACLEMAPLLPARGLTGGAVFWDGQMQNADLVNLAFARSAAHEGADLANYLEAVSLIRDGTRVEGARVRDRFGTGEFDIRARVVADMTGPWSGLCTEGGSTVRKSAGFQLVTRPIAAPFHDQGHGLAVESRHVDPDAALSRGGRSYFYTPWNGVGIWGTTDELYEGPPGDWRIREAAIQHFIDELNEALPGYDLLRSDVHYAFGGLRPLDEDNAGSGSQVSRKAELSDHPEIENLLVVEGVKYTTCRLLAERCVDRVGKKLGRDLPGCLTAASVLADTSIPDAETLEETVLRAIRETSALTLEDVALRRTTLAATAPPAEDVLRRCAAVMAEALHWDEARIEQEVAQVQDRYRYA